MACERHRGHGRAAFGRPVARLLLSIALVPTIASAQPAPSAPQPPTASTADAVLAASRAAFEARSEAERKQIQDDLVWASIYRGSIDGGFGRGTFTALTSFELAAKRTADGILDAAERAALTKAADEARRAVDWRVLEEAVSGARVGYPAKLMPSLRKTAVGASFADAKGALALTVERIAAGGDDLVGLFDKLKAEQPGRKVTYAVQRSDWFVVAVETGTRRSYSRFAVTSSGPVGFTFTYDAPLADGERLAVAIANAFAPVAKDAITAGAPRPVAVETLRPDGSSAPARPAGGAAIDVSKPVASAPVATVPASGLAAASALVVAPGRAVIATRVMAACRMATVAGKPAKVVATNGEAALLEIEASAGAAVADLAMANTGDGEVVALLQAAAAKPVLTAATGTASRSDADARVVVAAPRGSAGAAVFDRGGALVGLLGGPVSEARSVAGVAAEMALPLVPARDVAALLLAQGINLAAANGAASTVGELARRYGAAVVAVACSP